MWNQRFIPFRCFTIFMMLLAWLTASNHCALASVASSQEQFCNHCCANPEKGSANPATPMKEVACCKVLKATDGGKVEWKVSPLATGHFDYDHQTASHPMITVWLSGDKFSTGPPRASEFFSVDLLRGHPAHAPPFLS